MVNPRKRNHSSVASSEHASTSRVTEPGTQKKRFKQYPGSGTAKNVKKDTSGQGPSTSASSSRYSQTQPNTQKKRSEQSPGTGSANNVRKDTSVQNPGTCGKDRPPSFETPNGYQCAICLESINRREMKTLRCSHLFHERCIGLWLIESPSCPVCRKEFISKIRLHTLIIRINNGDYNMKITNGGIDMSLNNGDFIRLNNVEIGMKVNNDNGSLRVNEDSVEMKFDEGSLIRLNNGDIDLVLTNVTLQRSNGGVHVNFDNGNFMNFNNLSVKFD